MKAVVRRPDTRAMHLAFLPWLGLLYLWGLAFINVPSPPFQLLPTFLFTLLMSLHAGLYMYGRQLLVAQQRRGPLALYASAQGVLVLLLSIIPGRNVVLLAGLVLALMAQAITTLPPGRRMAVVCGYAVLCGLGVIAVSGRTIPQGTAVYFLGIVPPVACVLGYIMLYQRRVEERERTQALLHSLEAAHAELAAYADRIEDLTLLAERRRMARELHDTLAQGLAGLILQLEAVRLRLASGEIDRAGEIVDQAQSRARAALASARQAIDDLRAGPADALDAAIVVEDEIRRFTTATGISVNADLTALAILPAPLGDVATRVIVEGLANVMRHAHAAHVSIQVQVDQHMVQVTVCDDGAGFNVNEAVELPGHYGLLGLHERARLAGGHVEIWSAAGQGTRLLLRVPWSGDTAQDLPSSGEEVT